MGTENLSDDERYRLERKILVKKIEKLREALHVHHYAKLDALAHLIKPLEKSAGANMEAVEEVSQGFRAMNDAWDNLGNTDSELAEVKTAVPQFLENAS